MAFWVVQLLLLAAVVLLAIAVIWAFRALVRAVGGRLPAWATTPLGGEPASGGTLGCGGALVLFWMASMVAYVASLQWGFYVQKQRNAALRDDVQVMAVALVAYARDHGGRYPARPEVVAALRPYMPGRRLPESPWGGSELPVMGMEAVSPATAWGGKPWPGAAALAAGKPLPKLGAYIYFGRRGSVLYDVSPDRRTYVVYGLGERSSPDSPFPLKMPKLVAAETNARRAVAR